MCVYSRGSDLAADGRAEECEDHWGDWSSPSYHQPHPPAQPALEAETHAHTHEYTRENGHLFLHTEELWGDLLDGITLLFSFELSQRKKRKLSR